MLALLARCRQEVGLAANVELKLTRDLSGPAVCRAWRPVILVPQVLTDGLPEDKQRAILIHELCHIKRADPWVNLAQTLLQVFYFYNPLVWLANASIRRVREQAVDERVLVCLKGQLQCYSHTLIDIASALTLRARLGIGLIGVSESKTRLNERIQLMLHRPIPQKAGVGATGLATVVVLGCTLLPMAAAHNGTTIPAFARTDAQTSDALLQDMQTTAGRMAAAFNGKQLDSLMSHYAPDVIALLPGQPAFVGVDALRETYPPQMAKFGIASFGLLQQRVWVCGDLIYMAGFCSMTLQPRGASQTVTDTRGGVVILQRQGDAFKVKLEAFNRPGTSVTGFAPSDSEVYRCTPDSPTLPANAPLYDRIRELDKQVERMFSGKKYADALRQYADDAILMAADGRVFQGKAAIKAMCEQNADNNAVRDIDLKFARVEGNEQMVYVVKWCNWTLKNPVSGMDYSIPGKSLHVWQRQPDGSWKILFDLNNLDITL